MELIFGTNAIVLLGTMIAAIVAGFFAFMNLVASKENKVSEFRQDWINALRESIASYISSLTYLSTLYKHNSESDKPNGKFEMARDVETIYARVNESYNDIIFRVNESEKNPEGKIINDAFLQALHKTREHYNKNEFAEARSACDPLRETAKPLLKFEWKRVKKGEKNYIMAKYFSVIVLLFGVGSTVINAYMIWDTNIHETVSETKEKEKPNKQLQSDSANCHAFCSKKPASLLRS